MTVPPRVDLLRQGDCTGPMYILIDGWAIRYKILVDGRRQILSVLLPGDIFDINGFMAKSMDHSIASLTAVKLAELDRDTMDTARNQFPDVEKLLWCDMHVSAAIQREWSTSLGQRTARERMAQLLCELFTRQASANLCQGKTCAFHLTQIELAETLGMTPVYVNRTLQDLRREGLIQLENRTLTINDLPRLEQLALFDPGYLRICESDGGTGANKETAHVL
ncbi:Crp/Fnr family transcriptional regulator [Blastomonas sp. AAP53]|uniref:Crp/Fnr family transcriptional regulator n=1 Tax=Blastomonas sp. AAP53 TaxID=1248760 RepID=UPI001266EC62|nr:Crp/Fnr family transcriptional regulator [Blastomonas sp. AAP53]